MSGTNRVTAVINRLLAAVSSNRLRLSAVSNRLLAEVKFGLFLLLKQLADEATATQLVEKLFGKTLADSTETLDSASKEVGKVLADSVQVTDDVGGEASLDDDQTIQFWKNATNLAYSLDSDSKAVGKQLSDSGEVNEQTSINYGKSQQDASEASESVSKDIAARIGDDTDQDYVTDGYFFEDYIEGPRTEILDIVDLLAASLSKPFSDGGEASDTFARTVAYSRSPSDSVGVTDDIDGEAGVDDDQNIQFWKNRTDQANASETVGKDFVTSRSDTSNAAEAKILQFAKPVSDGSEASDAEIRSIGKPISDSGEAAEAKILAFAAIKTDSTDAAENAIKSVGKIRSDSATSSDSGTLLNQDYVDNPNYFADDYVGAKRAF